MKKIYNANKTNKGSYQLIIKIKKRSNIKIGALGFKIFEKGIYIYTGSAMKNLLQRVERHLKNAKGKSEIKIRWHIDYLLANENAEIIEVKTFPSERREECERNLAVLKEKDASVPVKGFGSSDCNSCPSHLIKIK